MTIDRYRFGQVEVDILRERVEREGQVVPLRPKSFALLCQLLANADRLVTKEELMTAVWPGMVVTDDSLTRCVSEVRSAIGDAQQTLIRTVPRRGYVFTAPLEAEPPPEAPGRLAMSMRGAGRRVPLPTWRHLAMATLALAGWLAFGSWSRHPEPRRMTLVVLPFQTLAEGGSQRYLGDTLTEDLTVALSRLHGASVVAPGTAFSYRDRPVDPKRVGSELGVRYIVQGSVEPISEGFRVSAGLLDTGNAARLWSDQFDIARADMPKARERIATRLASALDGVLVRAESDRLSHAAPAELDAEDLAMRCAASSKVKQGETSAPSYELCEKALELDPRNVRALVRLASYHGERVERNQSPNPPLDLAQARDWIDRALEADPQYAEAHCTNATVRAAEHRLLDALVAADRCRALDPSSVRALRTLAALHFFRAEPEQTLDWCERGMALSPRDPNLAYFMLFKGWAYMMMERDEEALAWLRKADDAAPGTPSIMLPLVSSLAKNGRDAEARQLLVRNLASERARTRTLKQWQHEASNSPASLALAGDSRRVCAGRGCLRANGQGFAEAGGVASSSSRDSRLERRAAG